MNFTALQAAVADYIHRSDLGTTQIPSYFIEFARLRIGRDVRGLANLKSTTISSWTSSAAALPVDLGRLRTVSFGGLALTSISSEELGWYSGSGEPVVYAVRAQQFVIPGVGASSSILIEYWAIPAALSAGSDISAGMAEWPHIWIHAATIEAALWQRDYETVRTLTEFYSAEVERINHQCQEQLFGNAPAVVADQPMLQSAGWL